MALDERININLEKNPEEVRLTVLTNVCRMLVFRGYLDKKKYMITKDSDEKYKITKDDELDNELFSNMFAEKKDDNLYFIDLDNPYNDEREQTDDEIKFNGNKIIVKMIPQKINDVKSSNILNEFLKTYPDYHKIIVCDYTEKAFLGLMKKSNLELFKEYELMSDLMSFTMMCFNIEIVDEESLTHIKNKKFTKILMNDPSARYINAKKKNILRVEMPNQANKIPEYYEVIDAKGGVF
jgi:hypothetical protein